MLSTSYRNHKILQCTKLMDFTLTVLCLYPYFIVDSNFSQDALICTSSDFALIAVFCFNTLNYLPLMFAEDEDFSILLDALEGN